MNSEYSFLNDKWNGNPKTVWSYKKQQDIIKSIIKKYPKPINLKEKLLLMNNINSRKLSEKIDPNWDMDEYINFLKKYIKYSKVGKIILANLIGSGIGIAGGYYLNKYLNEPSRSDLDVVNAITQKTNKTPEDVEKVKSILKKQFSSNYKNITPYVTGIATKSLAGYGAYKFLDSLDKNITKKHA